MRRVSPSGDARLALRLLGTTELTVDGEPIELPRRPLERALLVRLSLARGTGVADHLLARDLWQEDVADPTGRIRVLVHRLRQALGDHADAVRRTSAGYSIDSLPVDLIAVEDALGRLQQARLAGDVRAVHSALTEALSNWRGESLGDVRAIPFGAAEGARLDTLRVDLQTDLLAADLAQGAPVSAKLDQLVGEFPTNERLVGLSALAHYQAGRQADALSQIARLRKTLSNELGIDPSPDLAELEIQILRHDAALTPPPPGAQPSAGDQRDPRAEGWSRQGLETAFVGRDDERDDLLRKLTGPGLVTLTGAPGMGKTRLAREVAAAVTSAGRPVVWLDLASVSSASGVGPQLAAAVGIDPGDPIAGAREKLAGALLVLDNAEHLVDAIAQLVVSLRHGVPLTILVTSQRPLRVLGEDVQPIGPLDRESAIALFCARSGQPADEFRARGGQSADDRIDAICTAVDRLPLAIELAAGLTRTLTVPQIADRIGNRLRLLIGGSRDDGARHSSLRGAVSWAYDLLTPTGRTLLQRLSVFTGGCTLEAAEQVAADDNLAATDIGAELSDLVERCLVTLDRSTNPPRFGLLETVRDYALEQLRDAGEEAAVRRRHANWCAGLIAAARSTGVQQVGKLRELDAERANLRAAFEWSLGNEGEIATLKVIGGPIGWCGWGLRQADQDPDWLHRSLKAAGPEPTAERAAALRAANILSRNSGENLAAARAMAEEALSIYTALDDTAGRASTLLGLCITSITLRDYDAALRYGHECRELAGAADEQTIPAGRQLVCFSTNALGMTLRCQGRYAEAEAAFLESEQLRIELEDPSDLAGTLGNRAIVARQLGDLERSRELCLRALRLSHEYDHTAQLLCMFEVLAALELAAGRPAAALRLLLVAEQHRVRNGIPLLIPDELDDRDQTYAEAWTALGPEVDSIAAAAADLSVGALADELLREHALSGPT